MDTNKLTAEIDDRVSDLIDDSQQRVACDALEFLTDRLTDILPNYVIVRGYLDYLPRLYSNPDAPALRSAIDTLIELI